MRRQSRFMRLAPLLAVCALIFQPAGSFASTIGEVGNVGDSDSVSNLFLLDNHVAIDIEYSHNCPSGISACWLEIQFAHKCPEPWCLGVDYQTWRRVNAVGTALADCINDDGEYWEAWIRMGFTATGTKTVGYYGENERMLTVGGSFSYKVISEAMFNFTNNSGTKTSILVETATAKTDVTAGVLVSTSGGQLIDAC